MLGHLSGRLLLDREPYPVNQQAVIDACAETGTWLELNCNPRRFDLDWRLWPYAKSKGVKCVINPDAHRNEHSMFLRFGVGVARIRGGGHHRRLPQAGARATTRDDRDGDAGPRRL